MKRSNDEVESVNAFLFLLLLVFTFLLSTQTLLCKGADVLNATNTLIDGDTLISAGGAFELGFFSPGNSKYRYLGIWYKKTVTVLTVVWVANRDTPLTNTSGTALRFVGSGQLALLNSTGSIIWSTNASQLVQNSPIAQLLDDGNLVVKQANDDNPENYLWQSFENPTDTLLPGMKLGHLSIGRENFLSSWKSSDDPGTGHYTYHLDPTGYPQAVLRQDSVEVYRTGPWNGQGYSGLPSLKENSMFTYDLFMNGSTVYYHYAVPNASVITRVMLNYTGPGVVQRWHWVDPTIGWSQDRGAPGDNCDYYNQCGAHATCNIRSFPVCDCLQKFTPQFTEAWGRGNFKDGCVRQTPLVCETDGFVKYTEMKLPDPRTSWYNRSMSLSECEEVCRRNCSCRAYSSLDVRNGGSGCLLWFGDLIDINRIAGAGQDLYIRMASSELDRISKKRKSKKVDIFIVSLTSVGGLIIIVGSLVMWWICKKKGVTWCHKEEDEEMEVPLIEFHKLSRATNGFSPNSKIGEGGFGIVFKGTLDGQDIAVKRLSMSNSFQGHDEFKNEVICIARHQHKNLVKLMGYCIHGRERILIYEYLPNKSLDLFLFDEANNTLLKWPQRFHIIIGIARGLMYLHRDARMRIIHRDLKPSNILLDIDMNPKISDFGLARIFEGNEIRANTSRIVGTYGYMAPEYSSDGLFSTNSDVFSFGVIMLEIISGRKNRNFLYRNRRQNLLGHAWILHRDGESLELVPKSIMESCSMPELVLRSIRVGLLCVQANPEDRPNMSSVVNMLENFEASLPHPRLPGFFMEEGDIPTIDISTSTKASFTNELTISMLEPR